jgi:hypothetical protein
MRSHDVFFLSLALLVPASTAAPNAARACSGPRPAVTSALPATGATDVSPMSSIFVVTGFAQIPTGLTLEGAGQPVSLPSIEDVGPGLATSGSAHFWRLSSYLAPSTTYVLRSTTSGVATELTRFTTAASYDKQPGQAPVLDSLRLWRVHYPVDQVAAGGCVFAEYEGYIDLNYQDGSVPGTPAEETVLVLTLGPKTGGSSQTFVFTGSTHFEGASLWDAKTSSMVDVPAGGVPSPVYALWKPTLEPDREYCATLTVYGRNDLAMPDVRSNTVCAAVLNVDARGNASSGCTIGVRSGTTGSLGLVLLAVGLNVGFWLRRRTTYFRQRRPR